MTDSSISEHWQRFCSQTVEAPRVGVKEGKRCEGAC